MVDRFNMDRTVRKFRPTENWQYVSEWIFQNKVTNPAAAEFCEGFSIGEETVG